MSSRQLSRRDYDLAERLYLDGVGVARIARAFGVAPSTLRMRLRYVGAHALKRELDEDRVARALAARQP